jgi:hypothetical protein
MNAMLTIGILVQAVPVWFILNTAISTVKHKGL